MFKKQSYIYLTEEDMNEAVEEWLNAQFTESNVKVVDVYANYSEDSPHSDAPYCISVKEV